MVLEIEGGQLGWIAEEVVYPSKLENIHHIQTHTYPILR
jgi:hypothetical protein